MAAEPKLAKRAEAGAPDTIRTCDLCLRRAMIVVLIVISFSYELYTKPEESILSELFLSLAIELICYGPLAIC